MEKKVEEKKEKRTIMQKLQKPIIFTLFFSPIVLFIYSLVFMTPFYGLYVLDGTMLKSDLEAYNLSVESYNPMYYAKKGDTVLGLNMKLFTQFTREGYLQDFNQLMFYLGLAGLLIAALTFLFFSQKRSRYYLSNYISVGISSLFNIIVGATLLGSLFNWQFYVNNYVDFNTINAYQSSKQLSPTIQEYFSQNTFNGTFTFGYVVCAILIISGLIGAAYLIYKYLYQRKHKGLDLSGVNIHE